MKKNILIFTILFFLFQAFNISAQGQLKKTKLTKEKLISIYHQKLKEINPKKDIKTKHNIKFIDEVRIGYKYNRRFDKEIAIVGTQRFQMEIDPETGKAIGYFDDLISHSRADYLYKGGSKPTKAREEIIKEAKKILRIINGKIPEDAYFGDAWYENFGWHDAEHSYRGYWSIKWGRKEGDYKYKNDVISITIDEKDGLHSYGYYFFSQYQPPKQINISKEKAIEVAKKYISDITRSPALGGWYNRYKIGDMHSAELIIVNPNYITKPKKDFRFTPSPHAHLAWVVKFNCIEPKISEELSLERIAPAQTWIDAETGELLGGR